MVRLSQSATQAPTPTPNESYADFVVRAHQALINDIPEPDQRNQTVWQAWSAVHGDFERQRADARFASTEYVKRPSVCYFSEHEANSVDGQGQAIVRRYDAKKLAEIIDENNLRIADVDAYPTIIDRHTAPAGVRDPSPPVTVGVAGPFRLGMIGRVNPRYAIFSDEYVRKDMWPMMQTKGGRSVELLTQKLTGRSYINPIAAISEAPRLPLPVQFSFGDESAEVIERYTAIAPYSVTAAAFPGGGNTWTKKFDSHQPDANDPQTAGHQEPEMQGNDQMIRQIVDAIMNTEQMQWVSQQMNLQGTPAGGDQSLAGDAPQAPQASAPAAGPPQKFGLGMSGMGVPGAGMMRYQSDENHEEVDMNDQEWADRYQALADGQQQLVSELAESRQRLVELEVSRADAERSSRLRELASRVPINLDAELNRCLYSAGSKMDDDQFESHLDVVETYAAKAIEQMPMVPTGTASRPGSDHETAKYQAQLSSVIRDLTNQYANDGIVKSYPELRQEAAERLAS